MVAAFPTRAMRAVAGFLMAVTMVACGARRDDASDAGVEATTQSASGCATDADCGRGLLCETCGDGIFSCVPGCRTDAECGVNLRCSHQVQCTSCPCPSGWCELDPCRDLDGDGFAAQRDGICANGRPTGDCDDAVPSVYPGGRERCANGYDDDCDGKKDASDDECRDECPGSRFCASSQNCAQGTYCEQGCCDACPAITPPTCGVNECLLPSGVDALGCKRSPSCAACVSSCPLDFEPVCGKNFATYDNACLAQLAGTTVAHDGECGWNEGARCFGPFECQHGQFCRTIGSEQHCSKWGTCSTDADCDLVPQVVLCADAGIATLHCQSERCAPRCP